MEKKKRIIIVGLEIFVICAVMLVIVLAQKRKQNLIKLDIGDTKGATQNQNYWKMGVHNMAKGDDGYYYLQDSGEGMLLKKFDGKTAAVVCTKDGCTHDTDDCYARFTADYLKKTLYYYNGHIFMVRVEDSMAKLVQINNDGSERKDVADLVKNHGDATLSLVFNDNCVYVYDNTGTLGMDKDNTNIIREVNLTTGESSDVFTHESKNSAIINAKSYGNKLLFEEFQWSVDKRSLKMTMEHQLNYYDYNSGKTKELSKRNISDYYIDMESGKLYFFEVGKGLYVQNLNGKKVKCLYKADDTIQTATLSYDGQYIYMSNDGFKSTTKVSETTDKKILVVDKKGSLVNTLDVSNMDTVYFGDKNYLFGMKSGKLVYMEKSSIADNSQWKTAE